MGTTDRQAGYSAIEMAIAVAIIGTFMLIVLWGTGLVDVGKTYTARRQFENTFAAVLAFRDRWQVLPGDSDAVGVLMGRPPARFHDGEKIINLTTNGVIDGDLIDPASPEGEQYAAWRDLRKSGFYPGAPELIGVAALPDNPFGGIAGFAGEAFGLAMPLCMTLIPGPAALQLDTWLDDGKPLTGRVRSGRTVKGPPGQGAYDEATAYTVCAADL